MQWSNSPWTVPVDCGHYIVLLFLAYNIKPLLAMHKFLFRFLCLYWTAWNCPEINGYFSMHAHCFNSTLLSKLRFFNITWTLHENNEITQFTSENLYKSNSPMGWLLAAITQWCEPRWILIQIHSIISERQKLSWVGQWKVCYTKYQIEYIITGYIYQNHLVLWTQGPSHHLQWMFTCRTESNVQNISMSIHKPD